MKINYYSYILLVIAGFFVLGSCRKEKIQPGQANTFIKYYGGNATNTAGSVDQTSDGGYILIGTSNANGNGKDIIVTKTDKYGNTLWTKVIGGPGDDIGNFIQTTSDGGYIISATRPESASPLYSDAHIIKLNSDGSVNFDNSYGYPNYNESSTQVIITTDGGYISMGASDSSSSLEAKKAVYIVKTNNQGTYSWSYKYGNNFLVNTGSSIVEVNDSTYFTSATSIYPDSMDILLTEGRYQTIGNSYNLSSNFSKNSFYNNSEARGNISTASGIILGNSGNAFVVGNTKNNDIYLIDFQIGNPGICTFKSFGTSVKDSAASFTQTSDGGFIIAGTTLNSSNNSPDIFVVKIDASGNVSWMKNYGGTGNDYGTYVKQTSDGGYIVSGTVQFGGNETGSNPVMALFKLNNKGDLE